MPVDLSPAKDMPPRKEWVLTGRFVLWCLIAFFGTIAAVNALMMTLAIRTFPGIDARNGYDVSQAYNKEIATARQQAERGWVSDIVMTRVDGKALVRLTLKAPTGEPIRGLSVEARIKHPSARQQDHVVSLTEAAPGVYEAHEGNVANGSWGLAIEAKSGGERIYTANTRATLAE